MVLTEQLAAIWSEIRATTRYKWIALAVALGICLPGWVGVLLLPDQYESRAQIVVSSDSILKPLLAGLAVSADTGSAADVVRRALLARPNIERVAKANNLLDKGSGPEEVEAVYGGLEKNIKIATGDPRLNMYVVTYTANNAVKSQQVVQTLIDSFAQDSAGKVQSDTESARRFLEQQVEEYKQRLTQSEQRLAQFKNEHIGLMPNERGDHFSRLQEQQALLEARQSEYNVAVRQRDELRRKLVGAAGSGPMPAMPTDRQIQTATEVDAQLQDVRRKLEASLLKFTDQHPEVISLRDTIARLEERRRTELGGVRATTPGAAREPGGAAGVDSVMQSLQLQLNSADIQVVTLSAQVGELQRRVSELRRLLSAGTDVEAQLADLNRDYGVTKGQYDSLLQRLETAKISGDADRSKDMKIQVLDPPRVPQAPKGPMRTMLVMAVFLAGVAGACAVAYLCNIMQPVFVDARQAANVLGITIIGTASILPSGADASRLRRSRLLFGAATFGFVVASFGLMTFNHGASVAFRALVGAG